MDNTTIKLSIVDNDKLVANLLADFLTNENNIEVISIFHSGNEFCDSLDKIQIPDIILLDLKMSNGDGLFVLDYLMKNYPIVKIIVLTSYFRVSYSGFLFKLGANAFLPKEVNKALLLETIKTVNQKEFAYTTNQLKVIRNQITTLEMPKFRQLKKDDLSSREIEVLQLLCQQLTAKEIASKLFITDRTVEAHKSNLLSKTGTKNTIGLILYAIHHKLIDPDSILFLE